MNIDTVNTAIQEAERFLERAKRTLDAHKAEEKSRGLVPSRSYLRAGPRETGALRRASMDLTRALADLRRGR